MTAREQKQKQPAAEQQATAKLVVGKSYEVTREIHYNPGEADEVILAKGIVGKVQEIDEEGDAEVDFGPPLGLQWVLKDDHPRLKLQGAKAKAKEKSKVKDKDKAPISEGKAVNKVENDKTPTSEVPAQESRKAAAHAQAASVQREANDAQNNEDSRTMLLTTGPEFVDGAKAKVWELRLPLVVLFVAVLFVIIIVLVLRGCQPADNVPPAPPHGHHPAPRVLPPTRSPTHSRTPSPTHSRQPAHITPTPPPPPPRGSQPAQIAQLPPPPSTPPPPPTPPPGTKFPPKFNATEWTRFLLDHTRSLGSGAALFKIGDMSCPRREKAAHESMRSFRLAHDLNRSTRSETNELSWNSTDYPSSFQCDHLHWNICPKAALGAASLVLNAFETVENFTTYSGVSSSLVSLQTRLDQELSRLRTHLNQIMLTSTWSAAPMRAEIALRSAVSYLTAFVEAKDRTLALPTFFAQMESSKFSNAWYSLANCITRSQLCTDLWQSVFTASGNAPWGRPAWLVYYATYHFTLLSSSAVAICTYHRLKGSRSCELRLEMLPQLVTKVVLDFRRLYCDQFWDVITEGQLPHIMRSAAKRHRLNNDTSLSESLRDTRSMIDKEFETHWIADGMDTFFDVGQYFYVVTTNRGRGYVSSAASIAHEGGFSISFFFQKANIFYQDGGGDTFQRTQHHNATMDHEHLYTPNAAVRRAVRNCEPSKPNGNPSTIGTCILNKTYAHVVWLQTSDVDDRRSLTYTVSMRGAWFTNTKAGGEIVDTCRNGNARLVVPHPNFATRNFLSSVSHFSCGGPAGLRRTFTTPSAANSSRLYEMTWPHDAQAKRYASRFAGPLSLSESIPNSRDAAKSLSQLFAAYSNPRGITSLLGGHEHPFDLLSFFHGSVAAYYEQVLQMIVGDVSNSEVYLTHHIQSNFTAKLVELMDVPNQQVRAIKLPEQKLMLLLRVWNETLGTVAKNGWRLQRSIVLDAATSIYSRTVEDDGGISDYILAWTEIAECISGDDFNCIVKNSRLLDVHLMDGQGYMRPSQLTRAIEYYSILLHQSALAICGYGRFVLKHDESTPCRILPRLDQVVAAYHQGFREACLSMRQSWQRQLELEPPIDLIRVAIVRHEFDEVNDKLCEMFEHASRISAFVKHELDTYYAVDGLSTYLGIQTWYMVLTSGTPTLTTNAWKGSFKDFNIAFDIRNITERPFYSFPSDTAPSCDLGDALQNYQCVQKIYSSQLPASVGVASVTGEFGPSDWYVLTGTGCYATDKHEMGDKLALRLVNPGPHDDCRRQHHTWECVDAPRCPGHSGTHCP